MENKNLETALYVVVGLVVAPIVVGVVAEACTLVYNGVASLWTTWKFEQEMEKGIKAGTIVKIDGQYYSTIVEEA